jgi:Mlc titration factor MtfA (ptsG expression regulator)
MAALTSPILLLLFLDRKKMLQRLRFRLSFKENVIEQSINHAHPFYSLLSFKQQREFHWRMQYFMDTTRFIIKFDGDETKIKTTIAFAAAQISLGLSIKSFTMYDRIIVYEDDYYSQINTNYHKGEVNPGVGIIVFSWKSLLHGTSATNDGLNLLLHEFAHALYLEHRMMGNQYTLFDNNHFNHLNDLCHIEIGRMRNSDRHLFRKYASTNAHEFFAVATENFFERSAEVNQNFPELYNALKHVYNHDPLKINY